MYDSRDKIRETNQAPLKRQREKDLLVNIVLIGGVAGTVMVLCGFVVAVYYLFQYLGMMP